MHEKFEDLLQKSTLLMNVMTNRIPRDESRDMSINNHLANQTTFRALAKVKEQLSQITGDKFVNPYPEEKQIAVENLLLFARERLNCQQISEVFKFISQEAFPSNYIRDCITNGGFLESAFIDAVIQGYPTLAKEAQKMSGPTGYLYTHHHKVLEQRKKVTPPEDHGKINLNDSYFKNPEDLK